MSVQFGVIGAFSIDHVVNAQGTVATRQCGGNAFYSSVGAMLWNKSIGVVAGESARISLVNGFVSSKRREPTFRECGKFLALT